MRANRLSMSIFTALVVALAMLSPLQAAELVPGDVIISGFQAWNSPSGQNPGEFVELFNTTDAAHLT